MDLGAWLRSLGVAEYEAAFREKRIDETVLPKLTAEDLKEIGVGPVGHRRILLEAIAALRADTGDKAQPADIPPTPTAPGVSPEDSNPRSAPLELQATVPECMVPFVPILDKNDEVDPFDMLSGLQIAHRDRVFDVIRYPSVDRLIEVLDKEIISPAQVRFTELLALKAEGVRYRDV
jgi:hypothetical protein